MKRSISIFISVLLTGCLASLSAQNNTLKSGIDSVNAILKANPYYDGFNEIAFFYSVDITAEKELVVEMNFDGPFRWVYKADIEKLDLSPKKDPCRESPSSICFTCKTSGNPVSCVNAQMILSDGGKQTENSSNICISFSARGNVCGELNKMVYRLLEKSLTENR